MRLAQLGWGDAFADAFEAWSSTPDVEPARVVIDFNYLYRLWTKHLVTSVRLP